MPRLRKPPTRQEDMPVVEDQTLPTEPIEIDLSADMPGDDEVVIQAEPRPEPKPLAAEVEASPLQQALDAQRRAEELQRTAQRERDEARRDAHARTQELTRERSRSEDAEFNSVLTAIAAEQSALDKAEADYVAALASGDYAMVAKAQRVMSTASSRIDRLEDNKAVFEQQRREAKPEPRRQQPAQQQPAPQSFEQRIASLPDTAKTWLRKHPEFVNDAALNDKIGGMHVYLTKTEGVEAFSPAYFDALDNQFGFKQKAEPAAQQQQRRSMPMSAPVTRDVPGSNGQRQSGKTYLSPEEVQIARLSIVDRPDMPKLTNAQKEYIYAQNKMKLHNKRASGEYRQTTEQTG